MRKRQLAVGLCLVPALWIGGAVVTRVDAQIGPIPNPTLPAEQLITAGRQLFLNETFGGNGRTCATCHREENNFTLDPDFIATLPPDDPLFVAEFNPSLAEDFENPVLMRSLGLILRNADGPGDPANHVMRGVKSTLALLPNTLNPVSGGADGTTTPPNHRVGWSGDGAPGPGTLRDAIAGEIVQHFPKTLNRVAGIDFRQPTALELDAIEAFLRSIGRRADLDLTTLRLESAVAERGREIFLNPGIGFAGGRSDIGAGKCNLCHFNAGAGDFFETLRNANFNTNVEGLPSQPADLIVPTNPPDGGFGAIGTSPTGGYGNGTFNTPGLVEAADTGPFFHNNSVATIEGAVAFYSSRAFNEPPGAGPLISGIRLEATEITAVAAFLRVINALENIRSSIDLDDRAGSATRLRQAREFVRLSIAELDDAIEVLDCARLHPDTRATLRMARDLDLDALRRSSMVKRNELLDRAQTLKRAARASLIGAAP